MIIPRKLQKGDEIRVIAPSMSLGIVSKQNREYANGFFEKLGFRLSFGKHVEEHDLFKSSSIASRITDLHDAFTDPSVDAILAVIGGSNATQLLNQIDYDLIKANPKILCGYSDITALNTAIYTKTKLVTYSGAHYSTFAMQKGLDYTKDYFFKCLMETAPFDIAPSPEWSDDAWYLDQKKRTFHKNDGPLILQSGTAEGTIVGANIAIFTNLKGTEYFPSLKDKIVFLEDDAISGPASFDEFDRMLHSLSYHPEFQDIKGFLIGRFPSIAKVTEEHLKASLARKTIPKGIPVIANLDFGHTTPIFTFPIGGKAKIEYNKITIEEH